uniref:Uncharacterized protein n=2 Tax=Meloidogyne TaxID=189290 RepID=A0A6V7XYZ8_MELEN|nr:unnamed protein product [Meloidogyne enterolobii]
MIRGKHLIVVKPQSPSGLVIPCKHVPLHHRRGEEGSDKTKRKRACRESRGKKSKGIGHICTVGGQTKGRECSGENQKAWGCWHCRGSDKRNSIVGKTKRIGHIGSVGGQTKEIVCNPLL